LKIMDCFRTISIGLESDWKGLERKWVTLHFKQVSGVVFWKVQLESC